METELIRAAGFVSRLLANPAMNSLPLLQKEEQITQFLNTNAQKLFPTLSSPQFFPDKKWGEIQAILIDALISVTNKDLFSQLEQYIRERIDYAFISLIQPQSIAPVKCQDEIIEFLKRLLQKHEARRAFSSPFNAALLNIADRYIDESFELRQYIYFELTKVQRLRMGVKEIKNLVKTTLLLKTGTHLLTVEAAGNSQGIVSDVVQPQFVEKVFTILHGQLKILPPTLLKGSLNSNISFLDNKQIEATARLAAIFSNRARNYKKITKIDRGASTPDRSWFNIARKNYKYYGFDITMLDELYKIAAENGW